MRLRRSTIALALICATLTSCATMCKEQVPPGHVGMCRTVDGFEGEPMPAGFHTCWGPGSDMYLLEVSDKEQIINMNVLCKDSLNFKFDVAVLTAADRENKALLKEMFENITPRAGNTISGDQIFLTYAKSVVDQEARKVVSKYETNQIVAKRPEIIAEIQSSINAALKGSIVKVKRVTVNNLDFPEVVTAAQEERARRQVEIETEKAEQQKRLLKAQNALKVASLEYEQSLLEASMISDSNKIIGQSITPEYLAWWQMKVMSEAASGPNNWGFIPYTDFSSNMTTNPAKWTSSKNLVDDELRNKIREIREKSQANLKASDHAQATPAAPADDAPAK